MNFTNIVRLKRPITFAELEQHCRKTCETLIWLNVETGNDEIITISEPEFQVAVLTREDDGAAVNVTHTGGFFLNTLAGLIEKEGCELTIE
ncbi:MAG: hypothetical protein AAF456_19700 [Planctomycetota bacterium]